MPRADFRLSHTLRVRWAEVDPQNIVFNGHYLSYFDVGAGEYWRALDFTYPDGFTKHGFDTFVVKATLEYHAPARYDDIIDVLVRTARLGRTSLRVAVEIHRGDDHLVTGELIYVTADVTTRRPVPIPGVMRDAVIQYEKLRPEE
ncbi:MAG: thioesterase family protein [Polyangiales bacterium]